MYCRLEKNKEETGMFLFEIELLNGFTVDVDEEQDRNARAKIVDLHNKSVNVYFDQVSIIFQSNLCKT